MTSPPDALVSAIEAPISVKAGSLWLIRHAEVATEYQQVFGGRIDMDLSPRGRRQAESLAAYVKPGSLDALYASPMRRVQQTLAPLLKGRWPCPTVLSELREVDFGAWTGLSWEDVGKRFGVSAFDWLDQLEADAIPGAESGARLRARLHPVLKRILGDHDGQNVGIACHGGVIRMLLAILLDLPFSRTAMFEVDYASLTQLRFRDGKSQLQLVNFAPWRDCP